MSYTIRYKVSDAELLRTMFGNADENIRRIADFFGVSILSDNEGLRVSGKPDGAKKSVELLSLLEEYVRRVGEANGDDVQRFLELFDDGLSKEAGSIADDGAIATTAKGKRLYCKTPGQKLYVGEIAKNDICFGVGPAGTGKTYLAVAMAVTAFKRKEVERIILTRPAVEAGEKLGFLPGDLQEKVDPYLRPLYDALIEMFGGEAYQKHMERGTIEIAPLAYMRGRTLNEAFIILDEAQNATREQMKMFLTRMGERSKIVVTGDITQTDLPLDRSGLLDAVERLKDIDGIGIVRLTARDVVRHRLVREIIKAYDGNQPGGEIR